MNYDDDLEESFAYLEALYHQAILPPRRVELRRIEYLLERLGSPHRAFSAVHVTGTCGKGSTTTMIGSMLDAAGYHTGLFRSPHLQSYRERIATGSGVIAVKDWLEVFGRVRPVADAMRDGEAANYDLGRPSLFEFLWAMCALYFAEQHVAIAAVEVGVGGRLSPTNVLNPQVAVVTNVSLDHTNILGTSETAIAREKAAIIKGGAPACTAATQPEVLDQIRSRADDVGANLWVVGEDVTWAMTRHDLAGETLSVETPHRRHTDIGISLLGEHQVVNAATAISAIDLLSGEGTNVPPTAVATGMSEARFPGRFEIVKAEPTIVLDGARNAASAHVLRRTMDDLYPGRRVVLLMGVLGDKDVHAIVGELAPRAFRAVVTQPPWQERTGNPDVVVRELGAFVDTVEFVHEIEPAVGRARQLQEPGDVLLVTGSLYLVGAVRALLLPEGHPTPARMSIQP